MTGAMEMEEITQAEKKDEDTKKGETEEVEKTESNVYQTLNQPAENVYSLVAPLISSSKYHEGTNGRARLYWKTTVFLSVLCLLLLAVILALALKLNEVRSGQPCENRVVDVMCPATPQTCNLKICQDMYPSQAVDTNGHQCCGKGWLRFENSCYYMSQERLSWQESRDVCQKLGGDLAVIENERVQEFLTAKGSMLYWIGLTYSPARKWMWINSHAISKSYWATGHQQVGTCAFLKGRESHVKNWYPSPCDVFSHYICQQG